MGVTELIPDKVQGVCVGGYLCCAQAVARDVDDIVRAASDPIVPVLCAKHIVSSYSHYTLRQMSRVFILWQI